MPSEPSRDGDQGGSNAFVAIAFPLGRVRVVGITPTGRTTVVALHMNRSVGLGNPGGGSAAGQTAAPNISIRTLLSRFRGQQSVLMPRILDEVIKYVPA